MFEHLPNTRHASRLLGTVAIWYCIGNSTRRSDRMAKRAARWTARTDEELAEFYDVSPRVIEAWKSQGLGSAPYDLQVVRRWHQAMTGRGAAAKTASAAMSSGSADKEELERVKLELGNEKLRIAIRKELGELVDREAAKAAITAMLHRIRGRLEAAPHELAAGLPANLRADYTADAVQRIRLICRELEGFQHE
jgi:hypothetical protein